jgi:hypothetical protein
VLARLAGEEHEGEHEHGPWYALPKDGAIWMVMHFITLPIKVLVFATTPDVQHGQPSIWSRWWSKESLKKLCASAVSTHAAPLPRPLASTASTRFHPL